MANGMTTDVYHRDNCIAPDIAFIVWTTNTKSARAVVYNATLDTPQNVGGYLTVIFAKEIWRHRPIRSPGPARAPGRRKRTLNTPRFDLQHNSGCARMTRQFS